MKCSRCGQPGTTTWDVCADQNRLHRLCLACDIALNELVLRWAKRTNWRELMRRYRAKRLAATVGR